MFSRKPTNKRHKNRAAAWLFILATSLSACGHDYTLMSAADEARIGAAEHPKILKAYGGAVNNPKLTAYVQGVLARVAKASDKPNLPYQITILDTPVVNAFALPGGYTYITRGLLALANNEAELAGVIGHEIAHVTARHGARRHSTAVGTALLAGVLGAVLNYHTGVDARVTEDLVNIGGHAFLAGYSRSQEYEADDLGVKFLARAGYEPLGVAGILAALGRQAEFSGRGGGVDWFASHPNADDRVAKASKKANAQAQARTPRVGVQAHLHAIDGMLYGTQFQQAQVNGRRFVHGALRVAFEVPKGFALENTPERVIAKNDNDIQIIFDIAARENSQSAYDYLKNDWAGGQSLNTLDRLRVDGAPAAQANLRQNKRAVTLLVIEHGLAQFMRFVVMAPASRASAPEAVMVALRQKIERLTQAQAQRRVRPLRVRIATVQTGDNVTRLSRFMKVEKRRQALFKMLNNLQTDTILVPGQQVKLIVE